MRLDSEKFVIEPQNFTVQFVKDFKDNLGLVLLSKLDWSSLELSLWTSDVIN